MPKVSLARNASFMPGFFGCSLCNFPACALLVRCTVTFALSFHSQKGGKGAKKGKGKGDGDEDVELTPEEREARAKLRYFHRFLFAMHSAWQICCSNSQRQEQSRPHRRAHCERCNVHALRKCASFVG